MHIPKPKDVKQTNNLTALSIVAVVAIIAILLGYTASNKSYKIVPSEEEA